MRSALLAVAFLLATFPVSAQDTRAGSIGTYSLAGDVPFSADEASAASTGAFSQSAEPLAFHRNPALLAGVGRRGGLIAALDGSGDLGLGDVTLGTLAIAGGTSVDVAGRPLALGVGLSRVSVDFGSIATTTGGSDPTSNQYEATESAWSAGLGVGWSGPVEVDLGASLHRRRVNLDGEAASGVTMDLGTTLTVPVFGRTARGAFAPILDVSTGYAQRNLTVTNSLPSGWEATEAPSNVRQSVLGYGIRAGADMELGSGRVPILVLDGRVESTADLDRYVGFDFSPQGVPARTELVRDALIGDVDANVLILGDGTGSVTGRRAIRVTLFDALSYTRGHFEGNGYFEGSSTWGVALDATSVLRLIGLATDSPDLVRATERLTVRSSFGVRNVGNGFARSTFAGLTLGWRP